jgi:hypothetical protein
MLFVKKGGVTLLSLAIEESAVKDFMNRLLLENLFDPFEVRGVEISALTRVSISGAKEQTTENPAGERENYLLWSQVKSLVTAVIKNGERPRSVKIVFSADAEAAANFHANAKALFLNMTYENNQTAFTTACAQKQFSLDKSLDTQWDEWVAEFFKRQGVNVTNTLL